MQEENVRPLIWIDRLSARRHSQAVTEQWPLRVCFLNRDSRPGDTHDHPLSGIFELENCNQASIMGGWEWMVACQSDPEWHTIRWRVLRDQSSW